MKIALYLADRCIGTGVHGVLDILIAANYVLVKSGAKPFFEWVTVSLTGEAVTPTNGLKIQADYSLEDYNRLDEKPDIWIIPAIYQSFSNTQKIAQEIAKSQALISVIKRHNEQNGLLVSICSGSFILAEAGLLDDKAALMHWNSEAIFRQLYPKLTIDTRSAIADYGNIICAMGGGLAYEYLSMHLVKKFAGHQVAVDTAKLLMIDLNPPSAASVREYAVSNEHTDQLVRKAQSYIESRKSAEIDLVQMAQTLGISDRQLKRRFEKAIHCTPLQYLQSIRISHACRLLEATQLPSSKIVYQVGYNDESSFRRLFKKHKDMTMENYRLKFG